MKLTYIVPTGDELKTRAAVLLSGTEFNMTVHETDRGLVAKFTSKEDLEINKIERKADPTDNPPE